MPQTCPGSVISPYRVRSPRGLIALLAGLALSLGFAPKVQAVTTWTVCASGCDYMSIKSAIAASTTLDGDTLAIAAGTYTEPGITVNKSLTLQGERAGTTIVQAAHTPGTASTRVFTIPSGVTVIIQALTIQYGRASFGGGLYNTGTLTVIDSTISGNSALQSGGLENSGTLTLINSTVSGNVAQQYAGGGLVNFSALTVINSTISGNSGPNSGGFDNSSSMTLINSTVSSNVGWAGGGYSDGTLTLINSTVSGNSASGNSPISIGGLGSDGTLTLINSTVSGNSAAFGGLGNWQGGILTLTNSIVADNQGGDCHNFNGALITSHGYNLDSDGSCRLTAATDRPGVDPFLTPLQKNGGPTLTHALLPGSPAIDAIPWGANGCGTTFIGDQRWQARPQPAGGACDIGAYEVTVAGQPLSAWVTGLMLHTAVCKNVTTGQAVTLSDPVSPWDCEAAGLGVTSGDRVTLHVRGPVGQGATDVGGAVVGMAPTSGGCANRTTGQSVPFQHLVGATAASCGAAGLEVQPGETVQIHVQGTTE